MEKCIKCAADLPQAAVFCPLCGKKQAEQRKHRKRGNGTGSISKLSGNRKKPWLARKDGVSIGTYATRNEAQKALERLTDVRVNDKYNMLFKEVYQRWKEEHQREISDKMAKGYALSFSQCSQLHELPMRKILRSDYQAAIIRLEDQGMSKSTCNKLRVLLGQLGRWAMDEGITLSNPAEALSTVAKQKSTREILMEADIKAIKESANPAADVALVLIACGCRPGELFSVPLANCYDEHFIGGSKTEAGRDRVVPVGKDGLAAYHKLMQAAADNGGSRLIDGYEGNRTAPNYAKRDWPQLMEEIGREGLTPYCCRHTFITRAIRAGVDLPKLEAIVGHVDRETTRIYTHLQADDLVEAVRGMEIKNLAVCNKSVTRKDRLKVNSA